MAREQTFGRGGHAATQINDTTDLQRLARELGQMIGKHLSDCPLGTQPEQPYDDALLTRNSALV